MVSKLKSFDERIFMSTIINISAIYLVRLSVPPGRTVETYRDVIPLPYSMVRTGVTNRIRTPLIYNMSAILCPAARGHFFVTGDAQDHKITPASTQNLPFFFF